MKKLLINLTLLGLAASLWAVTLEWDPSPDAVSGYRLYASTNSVSVHRLTNALVKVDCGMNRVCTLSNLVSGVTWYFVATGYTTNAESLPSNEVIYRIPMAPVQMRTVIVQWQGTVVGTNWQDVGFFRIKMGP